MGRVKEIYSLMDECSSFNKNMSIDEIIRLEKDGILDDILNDEYGFEEGNNYYS